MLMHRTLAGLPELEHFESDEQRKLALAQIETEAGNPLSRDWWLAVAILVIVVMGVMMLLRWALPRTPLVGSLPADVLYVIRLVLVGLVFVIVLRWLHRQGADEALREKLLAAGVPVCRGCGYALRGLPLEAGRCPECGREFDEDVTVILRKKPGVKLSDPNP